MSTDLTQRFTGRANEYSSFRPGYPKELIDILTAHSSFGPNTVIADIGSGTGILSELFLKNGNTVFGVEPNDAMRKIAEINLKNYKRFVSVKGAAEATTLDGKSVDLITVGQALHWFDAVEAQKEFKRILDDKGYVCIIYNDRRLTSYSGIMEEYGRVVRLYGRERVSVGRVKDEKLSDYYPEWKIRKFSLPNKQSLNFEGLVGRIVSASYMPKPGEADYASLRRDLKEVFDRCQERGQVAIEYETNLYIVTPTS